MNLTSNPITRKEDDLIGVTEKADYLAKLIRNTTEASLRVGLFGEWGSGKTSLLKLVENEILDKGTYKFVWFNPWLFSSEDELINGFNSEVFINFNDSLEKIAPPESQMKKAFGSAKKLFQKDHLEKFGLEKVGVAINLVTNIFKNIAFNKERIQKLIQADKSRVVFVIEDLDRCEGRILAPFLLYIRELLDIKGVTTILISEYDAITDALTVGSSEHSFIEKIYDIPLHLAHSNKSLASQFLMNFKDNPFSDEIIKKHEKLLPVNPRFLKKFCKQLQIVKPELSRYSSDEIREESLYLIQLLKFRFPTFFEYLLQNEEVLSEITTGEKKLYDNISEKEKVENLQLSLESVIFANFDREVRDKKNIVKVFESIWFKSSSFPSQDIIKYGPFVERPVTITKKELESLYLKRIERLTVEDLKNLKTEKHLTNLDVSKILLYLRNIKLESYFDTVMDVDGQKLLGEVLEILKVIENYTSAEDVQFEYSAEEFGAYSEEFRSWSGVLKERGDSPEQLIGDILKIQYKLLDTFFEETKDLAGLVNKAKATVSHHRIFRHENDFVDYLESKIERNGPNVIDSFLDEVIHTKAESLCDQKFMSHYSHYLNENTFKQLLDKLESLDGPASTEIIFNYFEFWRIDRSLVLNYFTDYHIFIKNYETILKRVWSRVDRKFLTSWSRVKCKEIDKALNEIFPEVENSNSNEH